MSQHWQGSFKGGGGADLFYQATRPSRPPKAVVAMVHGMGDHSGGLVHLADGLVNQGYACYCKDLRGHGRSPGVRGHVRAWADLRSDLVAFLQLVAELEPGRPLVLLGHSLGGLITLEAVLRRPADLPALSGLISITPAVAVNMSRLTMALLRPLALIAPDLVITNPPNYAALTRDPAVAERLAADSLRHSQMTVAGGREFLQARSFVWEQAGSLNLPWLLVVGTADPTTPAEPLRRFFEAAGQGDKHLLEYEGALHRPFDDLVRERVIDDLATWIDGQLASNMEVYA